MEIMVKFFLLAMLLLSAVSRGLSQDTTFLLIGPTDGINQSWRTFEIPTIRFKTDAAYGFEGGVNVFYKSKGVFGFSGDVSFLQTRSAITVYEYREEVKVDETARWLTAGANVIFFPLPKSKMLPFIGTGMQVAYLNSTDASLKITVYPKTVYNLTTDLEDLRTNHIYFFKVVAGTTINQIRRHRIMLLATWSKKLGQLVEDRPSRFPPIYLLSEYSISSLTLKLAVTI